MKTIYIHTNFASYFSALNWSPVLLVTCSESPCIRIEARVLSRFITKFSLLLVLYFLYTKFPSFTLYSSMVLMLNIIIIQRISLFILARWIEAPPYLPQVLNHSIYESKFAFFLYHKVLCLHFIFSEPSFQLYFTLYSLIVLALNIIIGQISYPFLFYTFKHSSVYEISWNFILLHSFCIFTSF